jgi:16S rRNA (guanine527-N7)-methyltransferase
MEHESAGSVEAADPREARLAELIASSPHNLVSRGDRELLASAHLPEARALLPHLGLVPGSRWVDLGTGGGLPGLVLAMGSPDVEWVLVDSTRKKIEAVRGFASELELGNVRSVVGRAEELGRDREHRGRFDGVVARAVAAMPVLVELARGFVRDGGVLGAVKGPGWQAELDAAAGAMKVLRWRDPQTTHIASAVRATYLVRMRAEGPPPAGYPRRVGIPRQDPLGGR